MAEGRKRRDAAREPVIPCEPIDLLAGIAPGVELTADDVPPGEDDDGGPASMTVAEAGKCLRSGDDTVRRLIRNATLKPQPDGTSRDVEVQRAGVPPRSRTRPGE